MLPQLLSHLMQSTLFAGLAWLLALALRKNRAQVRFWIYFTASIKFLIPFAVLMSMVAILPKLPAPPRAAAQWADKVDQFVEPFGTPSFVSAHVATHAQAFNWEAATFAVWLSGLAAISGLLARALAAHARAIQRGDAARNRRAISSPDQVRRWINGAGRFRNLPPISAVAGRPCGAI